MCAGFNHELCIHLQPQETDPFVCPLTGYPLDSPGELYKHVQALPQTSPNRIPRYCWHLGFPKEQPGRGHCPRSPTPQPLTLTPATPAWAVGTGLFPNWTSHCHRPQLPFTPGRPLLASLSISFPICKMPVIVPSSLGCYGLKIRHVQRGWHRARPQGA